MKAVRRELVEVSEQLYGHYCAGHCCAKTLQKQKIAASGSLIVGLWDHACVFPIDSLSCREVQAGSNYTTAVSHVLVP